jgi:DNA polymerase
LPKKKPLEIVSSEVKVCTKCALSRTRTNAVPGVGKALARILFIGEAPGQSEDVKGEPFVGAAGQLLDSLLSEIGLSRKTVFITNIVKCRPPRNRPPSQREIAACTAYLDRQIIAIKPELTMTLGNFSSAYIFSKAGLPFTSITRVHGKSCEAIVLGVHTTLFSTFHPAAGLYSAQYREQLKKDFQTLKSKLASHSAN